MRKKSQKSEIQETINVFSTYFGCIFHKIDLTSGREIFMRRPDRFGLKFFSRRPEDSKHCIRPLIPGSGCASDFNKATRNIEGFENKLQKLTAFINPLYDLASSPL